MKNGLRATDHGSRTCKSQYINQFAILFTIYSSLQNRRFCSREDGAGKRAKLESDGMRELKSDLGSSFNDQAAHALQLRTCRRRRTLWQATGFLFDGWVIGLSVAKGARPNE